MSRNTVAAVGIESWPERLEEMAREWRHAQDRTLHEVADWETAIAEMEAEQHELAAAGRWTRGPADLFGVLGITRNELEHSAAVAWLLDPEARHGLGSRLLDLLLDECWRTRPQKYRVRRVEREVDRQGTRADIVVWADAFTLVIENKVDADEGWRQCDRLFERFGDEPDARFLLLSPLGRSPRTATGAAAEAFRALSYASLRALLARALQDSSKAAPGEPIVEQYLRTLETMT